MTLSTLMRVLALEDDRSVEREVRLARAETARAALDAVDGADRDEELVGYLRRKYQARLRRAQSAVAESEPAETDELPALADIHRRAQAAERRTLSQLRSSGVIGEDAFHRVEEELDWAELNVEGMARRD